MFHRDELQLNNSYLIIPVSTTVATEVTGSTTKASSSTEEERSTTEPTSETETEERKTGKATFFSNSLLP